MIDDPGERHHELYVCHKMFGPIAELLSPDSHDPLPRIDYMRSLVLRACVLQCLLKSGLAGQTMK
jgi:hypothetical protein